MFILGVPINTCYRFKINFKSKLKFTSSSTMDNLNLAFGTQVCLRNKCTNQYFCFVDAGEKQKAHALGTPPSVRTPEMSSLRKNTDQFKIVSCQNRESKGPITFGSKVYLINSQGQYLVCLKNGKLHLDKPSLDDSMNNTLFKTSTWQLQDSVNSITKKPINVYDDLVVKSVFGHLLNWEEDLEEVTANTPTLTKNSTWNIMKANVPYIPEWVYMRPTIAKHVVLGSDPLPINKNEQLRSTDRKLLSSFPVQVQQWYLIEDLLDIMLGFQGVYIKRRGEGRNLTFAIEPHLESTSCDSSLYQLCQKLFQVPINYLTVEHYIATNSIENGTICQALTGALRLLIKEYMVMVVQLDQEAKNGLTLQKMWYYVQPCAKILESLVILARAADRLKGGPLLSAIFNLLNNTTDEQVYGIYSHLFNKAIVMYINILEKWIYEGIINDKHAQFFVFQKKQIDKESKDNNYWDERFVLRMDLVPVFLQKEAQKILTTGKYLNVISQCGKKIVNPHLEELQSNLAKYMEQQDFTEPINNAYNWANRELNHLILNEKRLPDLLKSMKGFFFIEFGDYFVHFLETAEKDLSEHRHKSISVDKLKSLLELSIKTSTANNDPFSEDFSCKLDNITIFQQIHRIKCLQPKKFNHDPNEKPLGATTSSKHIDFFNLYVNVRFPLNLIIHTKTINKYQVLFRHIFWCKYIQRQLNNTWIVLQSTKQIPLSCYNEAYLLNQRMIHYCKSLVYNLSYEVIEHNWLKFQQNLKKVQQFEDIIRYHDQFLDTCLKESLLMNEALLRIVFIDLGHACQGFFTIKEYIASLSYETPAAYLDLKPEDQRESGLVKRKRKIRENANTINTYMEEKNFGHFVNGFIKCFDNALEKLFREIYKLLGKQDNHLANLLTRLDSENYYSTKFKLIGPNQMFIQK